MAPVSVMPVLALASNPLPKIPPTFKSSDLRVRSPAMLALALEVIFELVVTDKP